MGPAIILTAPVSPLISTRTCKFSPLLNLSLAFGMAFPAQLAYVVGIPNFPDKLSFGVRRSICLHDKTIVLIHHHNGRRRRSFSFTVACSASNKPSPSTQISSTAKIRSEVLSPFRTVRMFFYLAFIASGGLGGLIAGAQLISALTNPSRAADVSTILNGFGIDIGAVALFAFLYSRDNKAKNAQEARLSREEVLSDLKVRVDDKRIIPLSSFRGIGRLVILAGSPSFIAESFELSEPFTERLLERGVLVVPLVMNGQMPIFVFDESEEAKDLTAKRKRLWQLLPVYVAEWKGWLDEQKKMANVAPDSPVYMSLRLDGRVRGSGVGYPPWNAFVAQLPPVQGIWSGLLDGMDGRV